MTGRRQLSAGRKAVYGAIAVTLCLGLLEGLCRLSPLAAASRYQGVAAPASRNAISADPVLHHVWTPHAREALHQPGRTPHTRVINGQSWLEDYEVSPTPAPGTFRIFYVGDSNTEGPAPGSKMVDRVEAELNRRGAPAGLRFEVVNTGTSSYSPVLYYLLIRERILDYHPDLVVVNVDMTDAVNDAAYRKFALFDPAGNLVAVPGGSELPANWRMTPRGLVPVRTRDRLAEGLVRRSALAALLQATLRGPVEGVDFVRVPERCEADWLAQAWSPEIEQHVAETLGWLQATHRLLRARGVGLVVTGVPHYPQFTGAWSARPHRVLAEAAARGGYAFFSTYEALRPHVEGTPQEAFYWPDDPVHLNDAGQALWAEVQLRALTDPALALTPLAKTGARPEPVPSASHPAP